MNLLTNKAKGDFLHWLFLKDVNINKYDFSLDLLKSMQYSFIVDWFDSVEIYISISKMDLLNGFSYTVLSNKKSFGGKENTRVEAIEKAILKANEIYNNH